MSKTPGDTPRERAELAERFLIELSRGINLGDGSKEPGKRGERLVVFYADEATPTPNADGNRNNRGFYPEPWKPGRSIKGGNINPYTCISAFIETPSPKSGEYRWWRSEAGWSAGLALMVDDIGKGIGSKGDKTLGWFFEQLEPTAVIETSPGNHQLWYFLDEPCRDKFLFKGFLKSFVKKMSEENSGDRTINDIIRIARLPYGINNKRTLDGSLKYAAADGKPWQVASRYEDWDNRYSMDDIAEAFGFTIQRAFAARAPELPKSERDINYFWMGIAMDVMTAARAGNGPGGSAVINASETVRIRCPWSENHSGRDGDDAFFHGPKEGYRRPFVFGCAHAGYQRDPSLTPYRCIDDNDVWNCGHQDCRATGVRREAERQSRSGFEGKQLHGWEDFVNEVVLTKIESDLLINDQTFDLAIIQTTPTTIDWEQ